MAKPPKDKKPLNQKVTDERLSTVLATLEEREKAGTLGPNEKRRLKDLRARAPQTGGGVVTDGNVNPSIDTDTGRITDPDDVLDESGTVFDPNDPYWQDLYKTTYERNYRLGTEGLEERQARDLEMAKQEAAERGLPYDPGNRESAYGRAIGGVNDRYDNLYSQANDQAYQAADAAYVAQGGLANQGFVSYLQGVLGISEAEARAKALEMQKYGIDKDFKAKMAAVNKPSGSGGSSGGGTSGGSGFQII